MASENSDSQILTMIHSDVKSMSELLNNSLQRQARTEQALEDHKTNSDIHNRNGCSPCKVKEHETQHREIVRGDISSIIGKAVLTAFLGLIGTGAVVGVGIALWQKVF
jgi:hypothetical protein